MIAKKIMMPVLLLFVLASCGIFKSKHKEVIKSNSELKEVSKLDRDSIYSKTDKSITNTKTTFKGTIPVPGIKLYDNRKFDPLQWYHGVTLIDDGLYTVRQNLDSISGHLSTLIEKKAENLPIDVTHESTTKNDINETGSLKDNSSIEKKHIQDDYKKVKDSQPAKVGNVTAIALGSVAIVSFFVWLYFKIKKPKLP